MSENSKIRNSKSGHHPNLILPLLATIAAIGLVLQFHRNLQTADSIPVQARELKDKPSPSSAPNPATASAPSSSPQSSPSTESIGATILRDYANPNTTPEHDLTSLAQLMDNFRLLVKSAADHPLSANEDWSQALRGFNPLSQRFLPDSHAALNSNRQLIDRWGTPLFFHAEARGQYAIRSAGPDRRLWTSDDLQRNSDGSFVYGGDLKPVELPQR